jgi:hypothetical protein
MKRRSDGLVGLCASERRDESKKKATTHKAKNTEEVLKKRGTHVHTRTSKIHSPFAASKSAHDHGVQEQSAPITAVLRLPCPLLSPFPRR